MSIALPTRDYSTCGSLPVEEKEELSLASEEATPPAPWHPYRDPVKEVYYTIKQGARFMTDNGFPITERYLSKLASPGIGIGPKADRRYGGRKLYRGSTLLKWAESRAKPCDAKE
jgi:hypothetical protein